MLYTIQLLGVYPADLNTFVQHKNLHMDVHNCQKLEGTKGPAMGKWVTHVAQPHSGMLRSDEKGCAIKPHTDVGQF